MKRTGKALLTGVVLFVIGAILFVIGFAFTIANSDDSKEEKKTFVEKTYKAENVDIEKLRISLVSDDIVFETSEDKNIVITYYDNADESDYVIREDKNVLSMEYHNEGSAFNVFRVTDLADLFHRMKEDRDNIPPVKITIPKDYAGIYNVEVVSGDVAMSGLPAQGKVSIDSTSGDLSVNNMQFSDDIRVNTVSGNIRLADCVVEKNVDLNTTSGDIYLENIETAQAIDCNTVSGEVNGSNVKALSIDMNTTSGDVCFTQLDVASFFEANSISGSYKLELIDDINQYSTEIDTISGDCNIGSKSGGDKRIEISTTSGDIQVFSQSDK